MNPPDQPTKQNHRETVSQDTIWLTDLSNYTAIRQQCSAPASAIQPYATALRQRAESFCQELAPAVTDKQFTPHSPTHNPHDYVSIGTYWWPNPDSPDGLPYRSRDGQLSSDFHLYDRPRWDHAADGMVTTAKAAFFLSQPVFAQQATHRIRRWFCDTDTRMPPHLCYSQMIPGQCSGRSVGVIDMALYLPTILDHLQLIAPIPEAQWTDQDHERLQDWCSNMLTWLETHPYGLEEETRTNNHATYYDRLVVCLALFLKRQDRARQQLLKTQQRISQQIEPDGSMPRELRRSCSFGYSLMNLRGLVDLAWISQRLDLPLWSHCTDSSRSITSAVDFLYTHAASHDPWPYTQIEPIHWHMLFPVFSKANTLADHPYSYANIAHRLPPDCIPDYLPMIEPTHPFGESRSFAETTKT